MNSNRRDNENELIRVVDCRIGFIIPYIEEAHKLLKMLEAKYTGIGSYETNGFVFTKTGEYTPEFIGAPVLRTGFNGKGINGKGYTCFSALEKFRREFPHILIKLLRAA